MSEKGQEIPGKEIAGLLEEAKNRQREQEEAAKANGPEAKPEKASLSTAQLCLELPLYSSVKTTDRDLLRRLRVGTVQFDAHCLGCEKETTFRTRRSTGGGAGSMAKDQLWMLKPGTFDVEVFCQRNALHRYLFAFEYSGPNLVKYGQLPSMADIAGAEIRKYRKVLPQGYFSELMRATGLASHGVGIGAFVYLRRIFERLIDEHSSRVKDGLPEDFDGLRMAEKIKALASELPRALVDNSSMWGILSKGVHELDEETCRKYFPVVRQGIITILEQDYRRRQQEAEEESLRAQIANITSEI